jgi:DHA1 family 2-module integral membrane pump EmrD-like MFS transporter
LTGFCLNGHFLSIGESDLRLLLAILLLSSAQFGTQLFLPALPDIAAHFNLSDADAQQMIMLFFISFGLSQLFYGPWADAVGPRKVFYAGQIVFLLGSVLCSVASSANMLALGRILQGLGAGGPLILSRVILGSTMTGDKLKKAFGSLAIAASIVSVLSPLIGGWLTTTLGWSFTFMAFTVYLVVTSIIGLLLLPPSQQSRHSLSFRRSLRDYGSLLMNKKFVTAGSFKWLPTILFLSAATYLPFVLQDKFALSAEQYGSYMMIPMCGLIIGSSVARWIQKYYSSQTIIAMFWPLIVLCGLILQFYPTTLISTLVAFSVFMVACGAFYPSSLQLVIEPFKEKAGTASALVGAIDMFVFSMLAAAVNRYWVTDIQSLGTIYLLVSVLLAVNWGVLYLATSRPAANEVAHELV